MSYFDSKKLREERKAIVDQMGALASEVKTSERSMNTEELSKWDNLDAAQKDLLSKIESAERFLSLPVADVQERSIQDAVQKHAANGTYSNYDCDQVVRGWLLRASGENVPEECQRSAMKMRLNIASNSLPVSQRDQTVGTTTAGGHAVNTGPFIGFEKYTLQHGGLETFCRVLNTSSGNTLPMLNNNDTGNSGAVEPELDTTANTSFVLGKMTLSAFRVSSAVYKISKELLQDSEISISSFVSEILAERLARKASNLYLNGSGGGTEHSGLVTQVTGDSNVTLDSSTAISYQNLTNIFHSVDPSYRTNASWMFNDNTLSILKAMVDDNGRPLWVSSLTMGSPDQLLGKPIHIVQEVKSVGDDNLKCMYFGDFSKVIIRKVGGVDIQTLNEIFALEYAIGVTANERSDILLTNTSAVKFVKSKDTTP